MLAVSSREGSSGGSSGCSRIPFTRATTKQTNDEDDDEDARTHAPVMDLADHEIFTPRAELDEGTRDAPRNATA